MSTNPPNVGVLQQLFLRVKDNIPNFKTFICLTSQEPEDLQGQPQPDNCNSWDTGLWGWRRVITKETVTDTAIVTGTAVAVPKLATVGLGLLGYTGAGIAKMSVASGLQGIGATGGFAVFGPLGLTAGVVALSGIGAYKYYGRQGQGSDKDSLAYQNLECPIPILPKNRFAHNLDSPIL